MPITAIIKKDKISLSEAEEFQRSLNESAVILNLGDKLPKETEKIISLGGDGTLIACVRNYPGLPILGVNYGSLGFLSAIKKGENPNQEFIAFERGMLSNSISKGLALNEIVIARGAVPRSLKLEVYVDDVLLAKYLSDGVIIATSTGSTAYSLSAGGPIVSPEIESIIITPICPHFNRNSSFVLPHDSEIKVIVLDSDESFLTIDGQVSYSIKRDESIEIKYSKNKAKLLYKKDYLFISKLSV